MGTSKKIKPTTPVTDEQCRSTHGGLRCQMPRGHKGAHNAMVETKVTVQEPVIPRYKSVSRTYHEQVVRDLEKIIQNKEIEIAANKGFVERNWESIVKALELNGVMQAKIIDILERILHVQGELVAILESKEKAEAKG